MDWTDKVRKTVQAALEEDLGIEGDISLLLRKTE